MNGADLAERAYKAYSEAAGGVSLATGRLLPAFEDLGELTQLAWRSAALAVAKKVVDEAVAIIAPTIKPRFDTEAPPPR